MAGNVACVTQGESQLKVNSTLASGSDLLAVLKRYPTFTSCQNAACSNAFFCLWLVDYALEGSMFCLLAVCLTLRGQDTLIDFLWLLSFWLT